MFRTSTIFLVALFIMPTLAGNVAADNLLKSIANLNLSPNPEKITTLSIDNKSKAPVAFFYLDDFDNFTVITSGNVTDSYVVKNIVGDQKVFLRYAVRNVAVPFILMPGDSINIGFTERLIPRVTFSKMGYEKLYNVFSSMTQKSASLFSTYWDFMFGKNEINNDSLYNKDSTLLAEIIATDDFSQQYLNTCFNYLRSQHSLQQFQKTKEQPDELFITNDSNLQFHNFRELLSNIEFEKFPKKIVDEKNTMITLYNSAKSKKGGIKNYLLFFAVNWMKAKNRPLYEQYKTNFINDCSNKNYIEQIIAGDEIGNAAVFISFKNSQQYSLASILKKNSGKLVYIDVWASWCAPCRAAMENSHKVISSYRNKPISFVYVSIDDKLPAWKKAVTEERLNNVEHNYFLSNQKGSEFVKKYKLHSIPRYLLFGKNGKLISQDAPAPGSEELIVLLDKLLSIN